eukprot:CAMPEP_0175795778 /NCGR_PEP_ID=MMETSP0097-20121207/84641_1 /TAXON_ID=311494 /ORGANISM="Alexandrium monilatum, Strain CCMP3105" /LENGTH=83 /DNA_ID=CAMNT_0017106975 /DNA_START=27 /DNA_END=274 /DNA_ORIENTATION=+
MAKFMQTRSGPAPTWSRAERSSSRAAPHWPARSQAERAAPWVIALGGTPSSRIRARSRRARGQSAVRAQAAMAAVRETTSPSA